MTQYNKEFRKQLVSGIFEYIRRCHRVCVNGYKAILHKEEHTMANRKAKQKMIST